MECIWDASLLRLTNQLPPELIQVILRGNHDEYLQAITRTALDARYTYTLFAHCEDLFAHVCASLRQHGSFVSSIATLGRIVPFAPYLTSYAIQILQTEHHELGNGQSPDDDLEYLLGLFRLLRCNRSAFQSLARLDRLAGKLTRNSCPVTYMIIRVLQLCLDGADDWFERVFANYIGADDPERGINGVWDEKVVDYRFLDLWEDDRQTAVRRMLHDAMSFTLDSSIPVRTIPENMLHSSVCMVGNVLIPCLDRDRSNSRMRADLVLTRTVAENLKSLSQALKHKQPILLSGAPGSGKTSLIRYTASKMGSLSKMITLHVNEQSDAKLLLGVYTTGTSPGSFMWRPGVLTTAVQEGRWILIEDLDRAPNDVIGTILPLIEKRVLSIPNRKAVIHAAEGFRIFATVRSFLNKNGDEANNLTHMIGQRHWARVTITLPTLQEHASILHDLFPTLSRYLPQVLDLYERATTIQQNVATIHQTRTGVTRGVTFRDLLKLGHRLAALLPAPTAFTSADEDSVFLETVDCLAGSLHDGPAKDAMADAIAQGLRINPQRRDHLLNVRDVSFQVLKTSIQIGRYRIPRAHDGKIALPSFSTNPHTCRILERVAAGVTQREPLLLVGETGVGKTTAIQHLAGLLGKNLVPFNLSQQSEVGDLLGGFKPLNIRTVVTPLKDEFDELFMESFSISKNRQFFEMVRKQAANSNWKSLCKLWRQAFKMVDQHRSVSPTNDGETPTKKRKLSSKRHIDFLRWEALASKVTELENIVNNEEAAFAFKFIEGNIVKAVRSGDWVLLDEINLASPDTLESISDLLDPSRPSLLLTESGSVERVQAHPDFRIFAAMNPANDVGKKDLPPGIRSRFTELYVESPDKDPKSLESIVKTYLKSGAVADPTVASDVSQIYTTIQSLAAENRLVDGAGQRPHFSLRTLTRTLSYAKAIEEQCGLRRALFEGFHMSFITFLDSDSAGLVVPEIERRLFRKTKSIKAELRKVLREPKDGFAYMQGFAGSKHWIRTGDSEPQEQSNYIITPSVETNLENLIRAASTRKFPILIQGPTSSGKTSMIEYLARRTGQNFVRINNHEHTDLQEYLGTYVSGPDGRLTFQEGVLVKSLRAGYWIVLDELNLAPSDVLEALNRLLDDNKELLIPETQETVRPHPNFMLFATQNPAGLYGGRKSLSRAFRNRFLELHFEDIPVDELQTILHRRTQLPESRCKRIVSVYNELSVLRQENRVFEQKSFATLRDLFRWALRPNDTIEQLAINGYMLLCERVRKVEERVALKNIINKVMSANGPKVQIDEDVLYSPTAVEIEHYMSTTAQIDVVWTKAMRRLYVLVSKAIENNEPILLVGETGCGKTTVCQMLAQALRQKLHIVNAHQNTETGDLIGSQRPVRNRADIESSLQTLLRSSPILQHSGDPNLLTTEDLLKAYDAAIASLPKVEKTRLLQTVSHLKVVQASTRFRALFEWVDGSLVQAMKDGDLFLLDEISLADDSVLERINSVLESSRTIFLAEKGTLDASITAKPSFQFFATMNPGGDYGKRELSPALRNRFTEIWVPALSDMEDVHHIVSTKLLPSARCYAEPIVRFANSFKSRLDSSAASSISIRDTLAWIEFINRFAASDVSVAIVHGAAMVYIDTLGANPAGLITLTSKDLKTERLSCIERLGELTNLDAKAIYYASHEMYSDALTFGIGPFRISCSAAGNPKVPTDFNFVAPTSKNNAMRVLRALQLNKPILLEGSPGVGKTALVTAVATAAGMPLTRINLSDQTDLLDLFGSDAPVEGGQSGTFTWRDAPYLRAMKTGEWVLLDEMNLAPQSVLEGLNACLDHRGEVFIPELGRSFSKHPNFRLFAAQNPHHQGGGRKGLPASFVNRFTVVYADSFESEDLILICERQYPSLKGSYIDSAVSFLARLNLEVAENRSFGSDGGPWEFNLRDLTRWLALASSKEGLLPSASPLDLIDTIFMQRFRTVADKVKAEKLSDEDFLNRTHRTDAYHASSPGTMQVGFAVLSRHLLNAEAREIAPRHVPRPQDMKILQSAMLAISQSWPLILVGPSGCGKTALVEGLAAAVGAKTVTLAMSAETDALDLLGSYEQHDPSRISTHAVTQAQDLIISAYKCALRDGQDRNAEMLTRLVEEATSSTPNIDVLDEAQKLLPQRLREEVTSILSVLHRSQDFDRAKFEWVDGPLIEAVENGRWLILDNANLCSAAVLDRLNSLLEPHGLLYINEHSDRDGSPRCVRPHPDFRIIITMDPKYGELSRAMRNRSVEIYLHAADENNTTSLSGLRTDSSMARFSLSKIRMLHDSLSGGHNDEILDDHFALKDQCLLSRFRSQLRLGLFQSTQSGDLSSFPPAWDAIARVGTAQNIQAFYQEACRSSGLPAGADIFQPLHPLNNQAVSCRIPAFQSEAMCLAVQHDTAVFLDKLYAKLANTKQNRRIVQRLARLRSTPDSGLKHGLAMLNIMERLFMGIFEVAKLASAASMPDLAKVRVCLARLISQGELVLGMFIEGSASKTSLNACVAAGNSMLIREVQGLPTPLSSAVLAYKAELMGLLDSRDNLDTYGAAKTLWQTCRSRYPITSESLNKLLQLETIVREFDVFAADFKVPLSQIVQLRKTFQKTAAQADLRNLDLHTFSDQAAAVPSRETCTTSQACRPHFSPYFEHLCRHFIRLSAHQPFLLADDMITLESLAMRQTLQGSRTDETMSTDSAHLSLRSLGLSLLQPNYMTTVSESGSVSNDRATISSDVSQLLGTVEKVTLRQLSLLQSEAHILGKTFALQAHMIKLDSLRGLDACLCKLLTSLLCALSKHENEFQPSAFELKSILDRDNLSDAESCSFPLTDSQKSQRLNFERFAIAIKYIKSGHDTLLRRLTAASVAWTGVGLACLDLYIIGLNFDPIDETDMHQRMQCSARNGIEMRLNALTNFRERWLGTQDSVRACVYQDDLALIGSWPEVKEQLRPENSQLPQLFNDLQTLRKILSAFQERSLGAADVLQLDPTSWQNLKIVRSRLQHQYRAYDDLTSPVLGFIDCLLTAQYLALRASSENNDENEVTYLNEITPMMGCSRENWSDDIKFVHAFDRCVSTEEVLYCLRIISARSATMPDLHTGPKLKGMIENTFDRFYERWKVELTRDQRAAAAKSSLYRYRGTDETEEDPTEEELMLLFPDSISEATPEVYNSEMSTSIQLLAPRLATLYHSIHRPAPINGKKLMDIMIQLSTLLSVKCVSGKGTEIPAILYRLWELNNSLSKAENKSTGYNIYTDINENQCRALVSLLRKVQTRFSEVHDAWPEHATPIDILRDCEALLDTAYSKPLTYSLPHVEKLHGTVTEWQRVASSEFSAAKLQDELMDLVVSWRRLELSTWASLFDFEDNDCAKRAASWWFVAFETIIRAHQYDSSDGSGSETPLYDLVEVLGAFLSNCGLGEYHSRISMLRDFHADVAARTSRSNSSLILALSSTISYYSHYEDIFRERLQSRRSDLEKEIKQIIQLASWKDRNIEILKTSAKSSHKKLFKIIRKYRHLLSEPVGPLLASEAPRALPVGVNGQVIALDKPQQHRKEDLSIQMRAALQLQTPFSVENGASDESNTPNTGMNGFFKRPYACSDIEKFLTNLSDEMTELRKATPGFATDENKSLVQHLKTRKRRLLADVLKDVRRMGFQTSLSDDVFSRQRSLHVILSQTTPINDQIQIHEHAIDAEFYRLLHVMPSVRQGTSSPSEDLTPAEIARCKTLLESLLRFSIDQHNTLCESISHVSSLQRISRELFALCSCEEPVLRANVGQSAETTKHKITNFLLIIDTALKCVTAQAELSGNTHTAIAGALDSISGSLQLLLNDVRNQHSLPAFIETKGARILDNRYSRIEQEFKDECVRATSLNPELEPVLGLSLTWLGGTGDPSQSEAVDRKEFDHELWLARITDISARLRGGVESGISRLRHVTDVEMRKAWVVEHQKLLEGVLSELHPNIIIPELTDLISTLGNAPIKDNNAVAMMIQKYDEMQPFVQGYMAFITDVVSEMSTLHAATNQMSIRLAKIFIQLAKDGFCTPQEKSDKNDERAGQVEAGTGLGDGEGAEDISKDIGADEDLGELAQEASTQEQDQDIDAEKDAVDMADEELAGEFDNAQDAGSDDEQDNADTQDQELDEETGQVDGSDPNAVDDKTWNDGNEGENQTKEAEKAQGTRNEDIAANEDTNEEMEGDGESQGDDGPPEENETMGEEAAVDDLESADPHMKEEQNLDLPENMNMDGEKHDDDGVDSDLDLDEKEDATNLSDAGNPNEERDVAELSEAELDTTEEQDNGEDDPLTSAVEPEEEEMQDDADELENASDIAMLDNEQDRTHAEDGLVADDQKGTSGDNSTRQEGTGQEEHEVGQEEEQDQVEQQQQSESQAGVSNGMDQDGEQRSSGTGTTSQSQRLEMYQKLGDVSNEWLNQHHEIQPAQQRDESAVAEEQPHPTDTQFEHLPEGVESSIQALGGATADQSTTLDYDNAIDMDTQDDQEDAPPAEENTQNQDVLGNDDVDTDMDVDTPGNEPSMQNNVKVVVGQSKSNAMDIDEMEMQDEYQNGIDDVDDQLTRTNLSSDSSTETMTAEEARRLWSEHETRTRNMSVVLTEHLRLILQPTQATKMRGDFRTGKRLNIKKIIPYIASSYKRDKIWMRRSMPSKRSYQIMLAIDDSQSMTERHSKSLAFDTMALVARSLSMLEVGELCIVSFGESVRVAHPFTMPFSSNAGADIFRNFCFAQNRTDVQQMLTTAIDLFGSARLRASGAAAELWQLLLIVSDGDCDDHPTLRRLARQAQEDRIMVVFIVVDSSESRTSRQSFAQETAPKQSILDLQRAEFVTDSNGETQVKMTRYLDTFPFQYYLIVKDVLELPGVLAGALRQWFSEVTDSGA